MAAGRVLRLAVAATAPLGDAVSAVHESLWHSASVCPEMADGRFRRKADISTALNPPGGSSALALESPLILKSRSCGMWTNELNGFRFGILMPRVLCYSYRQAGGGPCQLLKRDHSNMTRVRNTYCADSAAPSLFIGIRYPR